MPRVLSQHSGCDYEFSLPVVGIVTLSCGRVRGTLVRRTTELKRYEPADSAAWDELESQLLSR